MNTTTKPNFITCSKAAELVRKHHISVNKETPPPKDVYLETYSDMCSELGHIRFMYHLERIYKSLDFRL